MNIGVEVLISTGVTGLLISALGWFLARWMNRIESKVDKHTEERVACRSIMSSLIGREEFNHALDRVHGRLDEQGERVAALEVAAGK